MLDEKFLKSFSLAFSTARMYKYSTNEAFSGICLRRNKLTNFSRSEGTDEIRKSLCKKRARWALI